ncbi:hypothetical protein AB0L71_24930 [Streptomyces sp. NPDC052052]|uniref:ABC transporter permease subunit n=1 Tax=Streptomyces sp. NPDC052052 TaxID=3154756 RepID=UPI003420BF59
MSTIALRGPARVVLTQHRRALQLLGALPVLVVVALVGASLWSQHLTDVFASTDCSVNHVTLDCGNTVHTFLDHELRLQKVFDWAALLMMVLPAFIGIFVAGPVIGREMESGTYRLALSQSVAPARWLAAKLAVPAVVTLACVSVLSAACAWAWSQPDNHYEKPEWYERGVYGSIGTVPVGYALCMLALGALAGLLLRRTVAAMVSTVIGYGALVMALNSVRDRLWPTVTTTFKLGSFDVPDRASLVRRGWLSASGQRLPDTTCQHWADDLEQCLADQHITRGYLDYHPASHFWPLQLVETGILLALAALAVALTFRVLRRRHG